MFEVMLIGLLVLVLILIPLCIGFVAIVRWIMRRTRRVSGQTPVTAAEPLPPPGAAEKGVVRTESLTAEDTFAFETSGEQGAPSEKSREPQLPVEDVVETPHNTDKAVLQDQLKDSMMFRYAVVAGIALLLLIPLLMVESLVGERSSLYREVVADISRTSAGPVYGACGAGTRRARRGRQGQAGTRNKAGGELFRHPAVASVF